MDSKILDNSGFKASECQYERKCKGWTSLNMKYGKKGLGGFQQFEVQELVKPNCR